MKVERRILLPATPETCWTALTDWEHQADWMRDADRVDVLSDHREGIGVLVAVRTRVYNVPAFTERLEVTAWDPPHRLQVAHRSAIKGTGDWLLEPFVGGTRFTWVEDVELPLGALGRLAFRVYRPFLRHLMGGTMQDLRRALLAPAAAGPGGPH